MSKNGKSLKQVFKEIGTHEKIAEHVGMSKASVSSWIQRGWPRTEWTGETFHAAYVANMTPDYTREELLEIGHPIKYGRK
jgi:uncharacterized membrane protein